VNKIHLVLFVVSFSVFLGGFPLANAQSQGGGVDHPGTWFVGEGLKQGDFFSYNLCHFDYKNCTEFQEIKEEFEK